MPRRLFHSIALCSFLIGVPQLTVAQTQSEKNKKNQLDSQQDVAVEKKDNAVQSPPAKQTEADKQTPNEATLEAEQASDSAQLTNSNETETPTAREQIEARKEQTAPQCECKPCPILPSGQNVTLPPRDPDGYRHEGLFFRGALGYSFLFAGDDSASESLIYGLGNSLSLSLGGEAAENLMFHGDFQLAGYQDPNQEVDGNDAGELPGDVLYFAFGLGVTYYFMPINLFVSFSLLRPTMHFDASDPALSNFTADGLGARLAFGKEWWGSEEWGFGAMLQLAYDHMADGALDYDVGRVDIMLTATYN